MQMDLFQHQYTKYDVPLNHLDHNYIKQCNNASEIEKIIKILRSKDEGHFPDLERLAEGRLADLKPKSKLLWKPSKLLSPGDLEEGERVTIENEIKEWEESMKGADQDLNGRTQDIHFDTFPPIRGTSVATVNIESKKKKESSSKLKKRVKPREYSEWDKLDVDAELNKVDDDKKNNANNNDVNEMSKLEEVVSDDDIPDHLKSMKAEKEKNKGNEAFKAKDFDEALSYYCRSLSVMENVPAYNNRAQIYLNEKKWNRALDDCNSVIRLDPSNVKAHMRRAVARQGLKEFILAREDLQFVLEQEPTNKQAMAILVEVEKSLVDQKVFGRRVKIEEVEGSDEEGDDGGNDDDDDNVIEDSTRSNVKDSCNEGSTRPPSDEVGSCAKENGGGDANDNFIVNPSLAKEEINQLPSRSAGDPTSLTNASSSHRLEKLFPLRNEAEELFRLGRYGEAADAYGDAVRFIGDVPQSPEELQVFESLLLRRSESNLKSGDIGSSIKDCDAILKINPSSVEALTRRAMALEEKENYKEAYVYYRVALDADSNNVVVRRASDRCASALKNLFGSDWRSKLPQPPTNQPITSQASLTTTVSSSSSLPLQTPLSSSSSSSDVHELITEAVEKDCKTSIPEVHEKIASSSSSLSAVTSSLPATSLAPSPSKESRMSIDELYDQFKATGNNLFSKGEFNEAIQCFTKCIELKVDQVVPYTNRALCYLRLNQYDSVLEDCNQALIIDFHCTKALYRRALGFKMKAEFDKSLIDLETLLKIDPGNSAAKKEINSINDTLKQMKEKKLMEACKRHDKKSRQRINIVDVEPTKCLKEVKTSQAKNTKKSSMPTIATVTKTTTTRSVKPAPCIAKVTSPYEFMQAYNSAKFSDDLSAYVALFDALDPSSLPRVLSNKLECDMLVIIIRCLTFYFENGKKERARDYLESLMKVERFTMVVMFLSDGDKHEVNEMVEKASEHLSQEFVNLLKLKFRA